MGNDSNKMMEFNLQSKGFENRNNIQYLQKNLQTLQTKLAQLENVNNVENMNNLSIVDMTDIISKIILKQVETVSDEVIDNTGKANEKIGEAICEIGRATAYQIGNMKKELKQLESMLTHNNTKYLELQQHVEQLEKELKNDMKQYQTEMEKINNILKDDLN